MKCLDLFSKSLQWPVHRSRKTKICELDLFVPFSYSGATALLSQQDVCWLEISVEVPSSMDVVDTLENLLGEINDLLHRQAFVSVLFLFQVPLQVTALGEFENEHQTFARSCS